MQAWWPVLAPIAALTVNVIAQIVSIRLARGRHFLRATAIGFFAGALALALAQLLVPLREDQLDGLVLAVPVNGSIYAALSYCFFAFVNLGQSSIRIRIYDEIAQSAVGISMAEITRAYDQREVMNMRIQRLIESGDLIVSNDRYLLERGRFVPIARMIFAIKRLLLGVDSEFD